MKTLIKILCLSVFSICVGNDLNSSTIENEKILQKSKSISFGFVTSGLNFIEYKQKYRFSNNSDFYIGTGLPMLISLGVLTQLNYNNSGLYIDLGLSGALYSSVGYQFKLDKSMLSIGLSTFIYIDGSSRVPKPCDICLGIAPNVSYRIDF